MGSHTPMPNGRNYHKTTDKRPHHPTEHTEKSFLCCVTILVQTLWLVSNKPWLKNLPGPQPWACSELTTAFVFPW